MGIRDGEDKEGNPKFVSKAKIIFEKKEGIYAGKVIFKTGEEASLKFEGEEAEEARIRNGKIMRYENGNSEEHFREWERHEHEAFQGTWDKGDINGNRLRLRANDKFNGILNFTGVDKIKAQMDGQEFVGKWVGDKI